MSAGGKQYIVPTKDAKTLPTAEILTGRGFITGKSGSGKSNTGSVIAEQLLQNGFNLLIVDTEGEYFGLKEKFEILHVGADEFCDVQVNTSHAETIADIALIQDVPVILDVSGYFDGDEAKELIHDVVAHLFKKEKHQRKPFLLIVEEMQEYLPQKGGGSDLAKLLERVGKRGRKRGLGICGMSQRPSSVDKDFITQCDWMVWHRLTWNNDVDMAATVLGSDRADAIQDFDAGEGFLMTDWDETIERVQFRRKTTHDAGATPGLESYERPDFKQVSNDLIDELKRAIEGDHAVDAAQAQAAEEAAGAAEEAGGASSSDGGTGGQTVPLGADADGEETADDSPENGDAATAEDLDIERVLDEIDKIETRTPEEREAEANAASAASAAATSELEQALAQERRRNQVLEDEVTELRSILEDLNQATRPDAVQESVAADDAATPDTGAGDTGSTDTSDAAGAGAGETASAGSGGERKPLSRPVPPTPPTPEGDREGVGGSIAEFGDFSLYLLQATGYRVRLAIYKLRRSMRGTPTESSS